MVDRTAGRVSGLRASPVTRTRYGKARALNDVPPFPPRPPMATTLLASASATAAAARVFQPTRCHFPKTAAVLAPSRSATRRFSGVACSPGIGGVAGQAASREDTVRIVAVVGDGSISPLKDTPWEEVMRHTVRPRSEPIISSEPISSSPHLSETLPRKK